MSSLLRQRFISKGLRFQAGLSKYMASVATGPKSQTTILNNGLTVATESHPHIQTATVGVWINAGSRAETSQNNGSAHFLEHMAFKGTQQRTQQQLEVQVENLGAHLNAYTSREQTVYFAKSFTKDTPTMVNILGDILQNSRLDPGAIERERDVILKEQEEVEKILEEVVFDHLHATAFQGHSLGRTILGPKENILSLTRDDLAGYIKQNYTADRMVLVGVGGVNHDELVRLAEKEFGQITSSAESAASLNLRDSTPHFMGSEVRVRNDTLPAAHIAMAVQGVGWDHPDYYPLLVLQSVIGSWDRGVGAESYVTSPHLLKEISENRLANSYMSFNTSYRDTGLWGIYAVSENLEYLDELQYSLQREWSRCAVSLTEQEVRRARQALKASLLFGLDGTTAVAEDIGRQLVTGSGKRVEPLEVGNLVDAVTIKEVKRVAREYLWDREVAVVGVGPIESMADYSRLRGNMSLNRF